MIYSKGYVVLLAAGNIVAYPHAGIQFLDFANGDSLQLTGKAEILYDERTLPGNIFLLQPPHSPAQA